MSIDPSSDGRLIARNASSAYALRFVQGLGVLILTPYLLARLGAAGFGTYSVILVIATSYTLLEVAFLDGVAKIVAELRGQNRREELRRTVEVAVVLASACGVLALVIFGALALLATGLAAPSERTAFQIGVALLGGALLVRLPCTAYAAVLAGYQRYDLFNLARIAGAVGFPLATVVAVEAGGGVLGASVAISAYLLMEALLYGWLMKRMDPSLSLRPGLGDRRTRRRVASFGSYVLVADGMLFAGQRIDALVIAAIRGAAAAAPAAAALKLQSLVQSLILPFVDLLMPMTSDLWGREQAAEVTRRFALATRAVVQIVLPVAAGLALFAQDVVIAWLGRDAPAVTAQIVPILMAGQVVTLAATPAAKVLVGVGRVRVMAAMAAVEGAFNLALTLLLVTLIGAPGAALGTLLAAAVVSPLMIPLACRAIGASTAGFLRVSLWPALLASIPSLAVMVIAWALLPPSPLRFAAGMTLGIALAILAALAAFGPRRALRAVRRRATSRRGGKPSRAR